MFKTSAQESTQNTEKVWNISVHSRLHGRQGSPGAEGDGGALHTSTSLMRSFTGPCALVALFLQHALAGGFDEPFHPTKSEPFNPMVLELCSNCTREVLPSTSPAIPSCCDCDMPSDRSLHDAFGAGAAHPNDANIGLVGGH